METKQNKGVLLFTAFLVFFILTFIIGLVISNNAAPGDLLYDVDRSYEPLQVNVSGLLGGEKGFANAYLALADERMIELDQITTSTSAAILKLVSAASEENSKDIERLVNDYNDHLEKALDKAKQAKDKNIDVNDVLEKLSESTLNHQEVLLRVYDKVPEQAKSGILNAITKSMNGHETALENISDDKKKDVENRLKNKKDEVKDKTNDRNKLDNSPDVEEPNVREGF